VKTILSTPQITVTPAQLWDALSETGESGLDDSVLDQLAALVKNESVLAICADFGMSEHHLGGDDVVSFVQQAIEAKSKGYEVLTWYGQAGDMDTCALIVAYKPAVLAISEAAA
jgi:hypothetical protein